MPEAKKKNGTVKNAVPDELGPVMDEQPAKAPRGSRAPRQPRAKSAVRRETGIPGWYGGLAVVAMVLLPLARADFLPGRLMFLGQLSLGEWLILPLAVLSLTSGILAGSRGDSRFPPWLIAIVPALLWLASQLPFWRGAVWNPGQTDILLAWAVQLILPAIAFIPLLLDSVWRDRLFWGLVLGLVANAMAAAFGVYTAAWDAAPLLPSIPAGFSVSADAYGMALALGLPLLAAWQGGANNGKNRLLVMIFCLFLLPAFALMGCFSGGMLFAAMAGLVVAWAGWRPFGWLLGAFLCLLLFGYGAEGKGAREAGYRLALAQSASPADSLGRLSPRFVAWDKALEVFETKPYLGTNQEGLKPPAEYGVEPAAAMGGMPWYAWILAGSGVVGLGLWLALAGDLMGRAMGRSGQKPLFATGLLGSALALLLAGFWTTPLGPGTGAFVGFILALSATPGDSESTQVKKRSGSA